MLEIILSIRDIDGIECVSGFGRIELPLGALPSSGLVNATFQFRERTFYFILFV